MKYVKWKAWQIKIVAILLCILIAVFTLWVIVFLSHHIPLLYGVGIAIALFFYRVLFYKPPQQRVRIKAIKQREKEERRRWQHHVFYCVSKRARAAYLILCIEQALQCCGEDLLQWERALKNMWEVTSTDDMEAWIADMDAFSPQTLEDLDTFEEWEKEISGLTYLLKDAGLKERFFYYKELYQHANPILQQLVCCLVVLVTEEWQSGDVPYMPSVLQYIDQVRYLLQKEDIPLPHDEQALRFLMNHKDAYWGKPFGGLQFSILSKKP